MKNYTLKRANQEKTFGTFTSKMQAVNEMERLIALNHAIYGENDDEYLTPFDFTLEETEVLSVNEDLIDYNTAKEYIGFTSDAEVSMFAINPKHARALRALNILFTIAEAWNKADGFVPDFSSGTHCKWCPWFEYDATTAKFNCVDTYVMGMYTDVGVRFSFATSERAAQFGKQFIDLWNDLLLSK